MPEFLTEVDQIKFEPFGWLWAEGFDGVLAVRPTKQRPMRVRSKQVLVEADLLNLAQDLIGKAYVAGPYQNPGKVTQASILVRPSTLARPCHLVGDVPAVRATTGTYQIVCSPATAPVIGGDPLVTKTGKWVVKSVPQALARSVCSVRSGQVTATAPAASTGQSPQGGSSEPAPGHEDEPHKDAPSIPPPRRLTLADLQPADIILVAGDQLRSKAIQTATNSAYSHAMLYAGGGDIIEAIGQGVVRRSLREAFHDTVRNLVLRRVGLTEGQRSAVVARADQWRKDKAGYDYFGAAGGPLARKQALYVCRLLRQADCEVKASNLPPPRLASATKFFCSELVFEAFRNAGVPLAHIPGYQASPQDVLEATVSETLEVLGILDANKP